jgi:hypothetical protein
MRVERDPVRAHDRDRLATTPARAWFRLRHDLLASPARLATGRRLAAAARTAARSASPGRPARPLACRLRLRLAARAFGGSTTGPSPVDRRKAGSKHHLITDANGVPLACRLTTANRTDVTQLLPLVEAIPPLRGVRTTTPPTRHAPRRPLLRLPATPIPGSTSTGAYDSATNAAPTSTKRSLPQPRLPASSASDSSAAHCVGRSLKKAPQNAGYDATRSPPDGRSASSRPSRHASASARDTSGSNCVPAQRSTSAIAAAWGSARR